MISVIIKRPFQKLISKKIIQRIAITTLGLNSQIIDQNVNIVIGDDKLIHKLNLEYLGQDKATDVLSFSSNEPDPETGLINLGDIIISYPTAAAHAARAGNDIQSEIQLLVAHGILHLLGSDHQSKTEKTVMWQKQSAVLEKSGVNINRIYGDDEY